MQKTPIRSHSEEHDLERVDRLHDVAFYLLALIVVVAPIPLGANRPLAWDILGLAVAIPATLYMASSRTGRQRFDRSLTVPLILFTAVIAYALLQAAHFTPVAWHDPIWERAAAALHQNLEGAIAIDRQAALQHAFRLTCYGAIFFLAAALCKDRQRAHLAVSAIAFSGCLYAIYGLAVYWSGNATILWMKKWTYQESLTATFVNRNSAATFFGLCSLALLLRVSALIKPIVRAGGDPRDRLFYYVNFLSRHAWLIIGLFVVMTACVLTHSRAGLTATLAGWFVFLIIVARSMKGDANVSAKQRMAVMLAILAVAILATLISGQLTFARFSDVDLSDDDQGGRFQVYGIVMHMIAQRPFAGIGLGSFAPGFEMNRPPTVVPYYDLAHNDYLQDMLELGMPAAFCLFGAVAWLIGLCIRGIRRRREIALPGLGVAASALVLLHSTLDFSLQIPAVTMTYAFILGVGVAQSRSSRERRTKRSAPRMTETSLGSDLAPPAALRRMAFLCGRIEPGRDGVGDYVKELAFAFAGRGTECLIIAVNDRAATDVADTLEYRNERSIRLLRLPSKFGAGKRFKLAGRALDDFAPDWVSLHVVVYAFKMKGVLTTELYWLPKILARHRLEVQLHELWIGEDAGRLSKHALVGAIQRLALLTLLRRLAPEVLHTTNPYYQEILGRHNLRATVLPLGFGNIPVTGEGDAAWLFAFIHETADRRLEGDRSQYWFIGLFGAIYADWPADNDERLLARIGEIADRAERKVVVLSVGRAGAAAAERFARWRTRFPHAEFLMLGPQSEADISRFFNTIDFGLSSYPGRFLGKSSSAACMLDHGLPLIVFSDAQRPAVQPLPDRPVDAVWDDDAALEQRMLHPPDRHKRKDGAAKIVDRLLDDFRAAAP